MTTKVPKVFISYSHDNQQHLDKVLALSNKLRSEGIDCMIDQYVNSPSEGWPRWMQTQIDATDYVLMICTVSYYNRVMGLDNESIGLGAKWEGNLIYQSLYNSGTINNKFIPVIFEDGDKTNIPTPLQGATFYNIDKTSEYDKLYWRLVGVKDNKPELGKLRELPSKERKSLFLTGFIDVDLWNKAVWKGVAYMHDYANLQPPFMGLLFKDKESAIKIFKGWQKRLGEYDTFNELRISIVEGDVPGEQYGYYVHISSYPENIIKRMKEEQNDFKIDLMVMISRIHRMNPAPDSTNLKHFKDRFDLFHSFSLIPGVIHDDNSFQLLDNLRILKTNIEFRKYNEIISEDDLDVVLKNDKTNGFKK